MTFRSMSLSQLAQLIDHSVLKPTASKSEIREACELARKYKTAAVCIRPMDVAFAAELLAGTTVAVATVIGFPHGSTTTQSKVAEAANALANGATELDVVLNVSALLDGDYDYVLADLRAVVEESRRSETNALVKVIFENCFLSQQQIIKACELSELVGADFVKTSTGFASGGATIEDISLMRKTVGDRLGVKASGGVKTLDQLLDLVEAGASRIGCSSTEQLFKEFESAAE